MRSTLRITLNESKQTHCNGGFFINCNLVIYFISQDKREKYELMGKKFSKDHQPGTRGPAKKTLILEAIKEHSLINSNPDMSNAEVEKLFFAHTAKRAFNPEDENNSMLLKLLFDKGWASVKPELEKVNFEFDSTKPATQQANDILKAVSGGDISPDAAKAVMDIVKMAIDIEVNTELKQRIEEIEKALGINA